MSKVPIIALVGPPNAGKSTLFNTVMGKRAAVTGPKPGTTRDRAYGQTGWRGKNFILIDTGGLARKSGDPLEKDIKQQTQIAIAEADLIIFLADGKAPVTAAVDSVRELKSALRQHKLLGKIEILPVINKIDSNKLVQQAQTDFLRLGLGEVITLSALTGRGVGDFLDTLAKKITPAVPEEKNIFANVAIVGRPNVGKSTLLNTLAGELRSVVSPIPGTTRASVDTDIYYKDYILRFVDTAGMRRRAKIDLDVEQYSLFQAIKRIEDSDVVILLLDANNPVSKFEQTIAGRLKDNLKGIVMGINKIDLLEEEVDLEATAEKTHQIFPFLKFARVIPISAEKGTNIDALLEAVIEAKTSRDKEIPAEDLSNSLKKWLSKHPPVKLRSKKKPVVYDLKQIGKNPPNFSLIVNEPTAIHYSYLRHLENQLRKKYGFTGTAIKIRARRPER